MPFWSLGEKYLRWSKGVQMRGNLDTLESWASDNGLQVANTHLHKICGVADLLATPKVQLLQVMNFRLIGIWITAGRIRQIVYVFRSYFCFLVLVVCIALISGFYLSYCTLVLDYMICHLRRQNGCLSHKITLSLTAPNCSIS